MALVLPGSRLVIQQSPVGWIWIRPLILEQVNQAQPIVKAMGLPLVRCWTLPRAHYHRIRSTAGPETPGNADLICPKPNQLLMRMSLNLGRGNGPMTGGLPPHLLLF